MLFRKHIVSTRTLFQLAVAAVFSLAAVGSAVAANSGNPPLLVPYTLQTAAGTPQYDNSTKTGYLAGYAGDGGPAVPYASAGIGILNGATTVPGAVLSSPYGFAVDSAGDVYIADHGNDVIREVNAATGVINTIAGVPPSSCTAGADCTTHSGCADGLPAYGGAIGNGLWGVAVDSFGNVYFVDNTSATVSVVYRGGQRVADFINRVNPAGVARSGGVVTVGDVYHIGGTISLSSCAGSVSSSTGATIDNIASFEDTSAAGAVANSGATLNNPEQITLDSAGNIYIEDRGDDTVRVINTQETPQTFFEYTVQPGYMRSITDCNAALTARCPALTTLEVGTGINGPVNGLDFVINYSYGGADAYGNVYQMNYQSPQNVGGGEVAYAGGAPITNLLTVEAPSLASVFSVTGSPSFPVPVSDAPTPNELPLTYGNTYQMVGNQSLLSALGNGFTTGLAASSSTIGIRPNSIVPDKFGTLYYFDSHYSTINRVDQYTSDLTMIIAQWANSTHGRIESSPASLGTVTNTNNASVNYFEPNLGSSIFVPVGNVNATANGVKSEYTVTPSFSNPWDCIWGSTSGNWTVGPQAYDIVGDGCPAIAGGFSPSGQYEDYTLNDGLGNLYFGDVGDDLVSEVMVGTQFPNTLVGATAPVTQPIQVHFDVTNPPITGGATSGSFKSVAIQDGVLGNNAAFTTDAFSVSAGSDFSIDSTTPEFPLGAIYEETPFGLDTASNLAMYPTLGSQGYPTCVQYGVASDDSSWDCLVYVKFDPSQPGLRTGQLQVTTANGSVYDFSLSGTGVGPQLAIDGGQQSTVAATGLGAASAVAVDSMGNVYIADPSNNQIVVEPVSGSQSVIGGATQLAGEALKNPMGVAVDAAGNVYISDTGNNRVLEYNPVTATATALGNYLWIPGAACDGGSSSTTAVTNCNYTGFVTPGSPAGTPTPTSILTDAGASVTATVAPPQYAFKGPEGLAVDARGNVYVADTGNGVVVEIPSNTALGGATPLLQYPGAPTLTSPVAVAVDSKGFIYVADTQNPANEIVRIPPGGGDLQPASAGSTSALSVVASLPLLGGLGIDVPNGVAVDAAGNVYVSDSGANTVWEAPAVAGANGTPFTLSFTGLNDPAGLALDANGNLYVADPGNDRVLVMNRQNPVVPFGTVPQDLTYPAGVTGAGVAGTPAGCPVLGSGTPCTGVLTVTNIGNRPATLSSPFLGAITNPEFSITSTCTSPLAAGTTCTISPVFTPTSDGAANDQVSVNGTQSLAFTANGANPEVMIVLTTPTLTPAANSTPTITATVRSHVSGTPTGTVTFNYVIDAPPSPNAGLCGAPGTSGPVTLAGGVATYTMPALAEGDTYTVSAVYTPDVADTVDSTTNAAPIVLAVPGIPETVTATSVSYTYGEPVPAITGTVTPAPTGGVTYSFTSGASQFSPIGVYDVQVVFTGGTGNAFCSYGSPEAYVSGTTEATVTESAAKLGVTLGAYTTVYGAAPVDYATGMVITGAVGTDLKKLSATFTPLDSSLLNVGVYPVTATLTGKPIASDDYTVTYAPPVLGPPGGPGSITVTPAPVGVTVTAPNQTNANSATAVGAATYVANTASAIAASTFPITVGTQVAAGMGVPTGSILVYDTFIPITSNAFVPTPTNGSIPLACSATVLVNCVPATVPIITPCAAGAAASTSCTTPVPVTLSAAGSGTFVLPPYVSGTPSPYYTSTGAIVPGTHYFSFLYSGDAGSNGDGLGDFACSIVGQAATQLPSTLGAAQLCPSTGLVPVAMIVDYPDYTLTSTTGPLSVLPGNVPNGNGLPSATNQNTSSPQSAIIEVGGILGFAGTVNLSCTPQSPANGTPPGYETCFAGQIVINNSAVQLVTSVTLPFIPHGSTTLSETAPVIFDISTPASLPIGFNTTSQLRTSATRMVLAFLPFGVLAFCVRRRRRLSKALWMLIAIVVVSAGMSGCGGNQVDFYTPIPTGQQTVTVTASYLGNGSTLPPVSRSYTVLIFIN